MFTDWKALWKATIHMLAISALWYGLEFMQYGTLQWDRQCDNVIGIIFLIVLWNAYHKINYWSNMYIRVINKCVGDNNEKNNSLKEDTFNENSE